MGLGTSEKHHPHQKLLSRLCEPGGLQSFWQLRVGHGNGMHSPWGVSSSGLCSLPPQKKKKKTQHLRTHKMQCWGILEYGLGLWPASWCKPLCLLILSCQESHGQDRSARPREAAPLWAQPCPAPSCDPVSARGQQCLLTVVPGTQMGKGAQSHLREARMSGKTHPKQEPSPACREGGSWVWLAE